MDGRIIVIAAVAAAIVVAALILTVVFNALQKKKISFATGKVKFTGEIPPVIARKGKKIALPALKSEYYDFMGWYYDAACTERADIVRMPSEDLVLHAGWRRKQTRWETDSQPAPDLGGAVAHNLSFRVELDF